MVTFAVWHVLPTFLYSYLCWEVVSPGNVSALWDTSVPLADGALLGC